MSEGALLTMRKELHCAVKEVSCKTFDKECLVSNLTMSEEMNLELREQLNEAQQEVRSSS